MKLKKLITEVLLIVLLVSQFSLILFANSVYAKEEVIAEGENNTPSFTTALTTTATTIMPGDTFEVSFSTGNFQNIEDGLIALMGQLEYNTDILELVKEEEKIAITGKNNWKLDSINNTSLKFIAENGTLVKTPGEMFVIKFKVKETVKEVTTASIKIKGISASGGTGKIVAEDAQLTINIQLPPEGITSEKYRIETDYISRIAPNTTVSEFKKNVETAQEMVFTNKAGEVLGEDDIITTETKLKVGTTLQFTLIVIGDVDKDGDVDTNDLAKIKLHLIDYEELTGVSLRAADIDDDTEISINDIAQIKLVIIGLMEIK